MTEIEIYDGSGSDWVMGKVKLPTQIYFNLEGLARLRYMVAEFGNGKWLTDAVIESRNIQDSCEKKAIREAESVLLKAKEYLKDNYPIRYKWSYYKVILKNPIKTLYAKWLLR